MGRSHQPSVVSVGRCLAEWSLSARRCLIIHRFPILDKLSHICVTTAAAAAAGDSQHRQARIVELSGWKGNTAK